jgi:hypothetical protein
MAVTLNANTSTGFIATSDTSGVLQLQTGGTTAVTVDASQNVGIGTASPNRKFVVSNAGAAGFEFGAGVGAGSGNEVLNYNRSTSLYIPSFAYASTHTFYAGTAGGTRALDIDSGGFVGIGTSSPTTTLTISTASSAGAQMYKTSAGTSCLYGAYDSPTAGNSSYTLLGTDVTGSTVGFASGGNFLSVGNNGTGAVRDLIIHQYNAANIRFATSNTERMRIDSAGLLCIGTTSAYSTNSKVSINVTNATGHGMTFRPDSAASYRAVNFNNSTGGANVGFIDCTTSATTYSTSSDYRLKHDITPMSGALAKVGLLKPVTYKWNLDDSESQGFIAHELQAVVPECVTGEKDAVETYTDEDGNEQTRPVYQGIDTSFLVATLTAAIQEQQAIITSLTDRITALEGTTP